MTFIDGSTFDPASGEVHRGGRVCRLEPQPTALLALLAARAGTLVTHAEIAGHVWPDGRHGTLRVIPATEDDTGLKPASCDALYLRAFHHVADRPRFAAELARAARPGGRIAVIDFAPGTLWFHGAAHGVAADAVRDAFATVGWHVREHVDAWGGGMFLLVFEAATSPAVAGLDHRRRHSQ